MRRERKVMEARKRINRREKRRRAGNSEGKEGQGSGTHRVRDTTLPWQSPSPATCSISHPHPLEDSQPLPSLPFPSTRGVPGRSLPIYRPLSILIKRFGSDEATEYDRSLGCVYLAAGGREGVVSLAAAVVCVRWCPSWAAERV